MLWGADVTKQFHQISETLTNKLEQFPEKIPSNGVRFLLAETPKNWILNSQTPKDVFGGGFVSKRIDFDNFFFSETAKLPDVTVFQNEKILSVINEPGKIVLQSETKNFEAQLLWALMVHIPFSIKNLLKIKLKKIIIARA